MWCKHYNRDDEEGFTCRAFPKGVPDRIIFGFDHRQPFKGDNGIRFELKEGAELPEDLEFSTGTE
jgi:hypothetical protein